MIFCWVFSKNSIVSLFMNSMNKSNLNVGWFCREVRTIHIRNLCPNIGNSNNLPNYNASLHVNDVCLLKLNDNFTPSVCNPTWGCTLTNPMLSDQISEMTDISIKLNDSNTNELLLEFQIDLNKLFRLDNKLTDMKMLPLNSLFFGTDGGVALYTIEKIYIKLRSAGLISIKAKDRSENAVEIDSFETTEQTASLKARIEIADDNLKRLHALYDDKIVKLIAKGSSEDLSIPAKGPVDSKPKQNIVTKLLNIGGSSKKHVDLAPEEVLKPDSLVAASALTLEKVKQLEYDRLCKEIEEMELSVESDQKLLAAEETQYEAGLKQIEPLLSLYNDEALEIENQVAVALEYTKEELLSTKFLLEARQLRLISELQSIYPIEQLDPANSNDYAIRGIELPRDLSLKDDDQLAAALGYVVHLMLLLSKYLEIPLRYQLVYQASRSMIRDPVSGGLPSSAISGGGLVLPLYRKNVDRDRFDRALIWLQRDIEQILACRGVGYDVKKDMLCNLQQLFLCEMCPKLAT